MIGIPEYSKSQKQMSPEPDSPLTNTIRLLAKLAREKFFGKLTIEFRDGQISVIRREETIKP